MDVIDRCDCNDWKVGMEYVIDCELFAFNHGFNEYSKRIMIYCPWCGKELKE